MKYDEHSRAFYMAYNRCRLYAYEKSLKESFFLKEEEAFNTSTMDGACKALEYYMNK